MHHSMILNPYFEDHNFMAKYLPPQGCALISHRASVERCEEFVEEDFLHGTRYLEEEIKKNRLSLH
jgi:hypothetical protein